MSDYFSEHGGVTDEDMETFFAEHPDLRPLAPYAGHGPQDWTTQFASGQGTAVPPVGGVEPDDGGAAQPQPQPAQPAPDAPDAPTQPPTEPTEPPPDEPPPDEQPPGTPTPDQATGTAAPHVTPDVPTAVPVPDLIDVGDGVQVPRSQLQAAARFQQQLAADYGLQQLITTYLGGGVLPEGATTAAGQVAVPQTVVPDEDLDLDDPSIRVIYNLVQQQSEELSALRQGLQTTHDQSMAQIRAQTNSQWQAARQAFKESRQLGDEDVDRLGQIAARLGVLPQLMQGIDPITGAPTNPDPLRAFERALEIAMFQVPEYRDREFSRQVTTMRADSERKKKLGAVGGSTGSVSRVTTPPTPGSPEAKRAMLAEVGAMLQGEWQDPNSN